MPILTQSQIDGFIADVEGEKSESLDVGIRAELIALGIDPDRYKGDMTWTKPTSAPTMAGNRFYYFGRSATNEIVFYEYKNENTNELSDTTIEDWIDDAKNNNGAGAEGTLFDDLVWDDEPTRIYICVDLDEWEFLRKSSGENRSLFFVEVADKPAKKFIANRNHSFFELKDITFSGDQRIAMVKNYHMKAPKYPGNGAKYKKRKELVPNPQDPKLPDDKYKFDLYLEAPVRGKGGTTKKMIIILDPGGRNTGPPPPPPLSPTKK